MQELQPYISCLCSPVEFEEVVKSTYSEIYVAAEKGFIKHVKLSGGRHARLLVSQLPAGVTVTPPEKVVEEELNFLPAGKIPKEFLDQIVAFFREVSKRMKAEFEAHAWILWTKELGYFISVPKQSVSKASVHFTYDDTSLPPGSVIVCDIHSHNSMGKPYSNML
jgi:hypothetical protein